MSDLSEHLREGAAWLDQIEWPIDPDTMRSAAERIEALEAALRETVAANDALHNALAGVPGDGEDYLAFVAAQKRETAAIEAGRAVLATVKP